MKIDSQSGAITLPGGFILDSALKIEEFRRSDLYDAENVYNPGTPWYYHRFRDGAYENHPLGFVACFYQSPHSSESVLTTCSFAASRVSTSAKGAKQEWSLAEDARDLELNLRLLEELLGKPHDRQKNRSDWDDFPIFQSEWFYKFKWGHVWCGSEDIKTNLIDTTINLRYVANAQQAHDDYELHRKPRKPRAPVD